MKRRYSIDYWTKWGGKYAMTCHTSHDGLKSARDTYNSIIRDHDVTTIVLWEEVPELRSWRELALFSGNVSWQLKLSLEERERLVATFYGQDDYEVIIGRASYEHD